MSAVTYYAKRKLISGHSAEVEYSFDVRFSEAAPSLEGEKTDQITLGGAPHVTLNSLYTEYSFQSLKVKPADQPQFEEFLYSVAGGEPFQLDLYGTSLAPDDPRQFVMIGKPQFAQNGFERSYRFKAIET